VTARAQASGEAEVTARACVALFGASNLTLSFARVVALLRARHRAPLEVISAHGHGRSYGLASSVLGRELPGILASGAWRALATPRSPPADALLTDIGNDVMYGADAPTIAGWVEECVERLREHDARVVIVRLPLASLEQLSHARFAVARAVFFPTRRLELEVVRERARALDARLVAIASTHEVKLVEPRREWYGLDPIHIRRSARDAAWRTMLGAWDPAGAPTGAARPSIADRWALARLRPESRRLFGRAQHRDQPSVVLADGTTIAAY
jgi:hypothetical protein